MEDTLLSGSYDPLSSPAGTDLEMPPIGTVPGRPGTDAKGLFPLPRLVAQRIECRGGHSRRRRRRLEARVNETNRALGRLEQIHSGRLHEEVEFASVPAPAHCDR